MSAPNFIIFLTDDQGYGDLSCMGCADFRTPRLDRMARDGARFTDWYSNSPVCSPSRAALLTGRYPGNAGVRSILAGHRTASGLPQSTPTLATQLKQLDYQTYMTGKWHLGLAESSRPHQHGFDRWYGFMAGCIDYYSHIFYWGMNNPGPGINPTHDLWEDGVEQWQDGEYFTEMITAKALAYLRDAAKEDRPFFLYVPFCIPHAELTVPEDSIEPYLKLGWPEKPRIEGVGNTGGGKDAGYGSQYKRGYCGQSHPHAAYAGMISRMDRSVGRILDLLEELQLSEKTLVFFSSDNGPSDEGGQTLRFFNSSGPLSGHKRSMHEGGLRVPTIARWKGRIKPGSVSDHPSAFWDFLPTACEVAGIEVPHKIDGLSFLPELLGKAEEQRKHKYLYWPWALRVGKWKLHPRGKDRYALFDLENDIGEKHDVASQHPELVSRYVKYFKDARQPLK